MITLIHGRIEGGTPEGSVASPAPEHSALFRRSPHGGCEALNLSITSRWWAASPASASVKTLSSSRTELSGGGRALPVRRRLPRELVTGA